jgi:hypothetical protein
MFAQLCIGLRARAVRLLTCWRSCGDHHCAMPRYLCFAALFDHPTATYCTPLLPSSCPLVLMLCTHCYLALLCAATLCAPPHHPLCCLLLPLLLLLPRPDRVRVIAGAFALHTLLPCSHGTAHHAPRCLSRHCCCCRHRSCTGHCWGFRSAHSATMLTWTSSSCSPLSVAAAAATDRVRVPAALRGLQRHGRQGG